MSIWNDCWELFFPRYCVVCGTRLSKTEDCLCFSCLSRLPRTHLHLQKDNEMEKNFWGRFPLGKATAFLYYAKGLDSGTKKAGAHFSLEKGEIPFIFVF